MTDGSIATMLIRTPVGELAIMAEVSFSGRELFLARAHVQGEDVRTHSLGAARLRQILRAVAEGWTSMPSPLAERLGLPAQGEDGFLVRSGSPARYLLSAEPQFHKSISAVRILARRHVSLAVAKRAVEAVLGRGEVIVDVPLVEDAAAFERELAELGVRSLRCEPELQAAATEAKSRRR